MYICFFSQQQAAKKLANMLLLTEMVKKEDMRRLYADHSDMLPPVSMFHGSRML